MLNGPSCPINIWPDTPPDTRTILYVITIILEERLVKVNYRLFLNYRIISFNPGLFAKN